MKRPNLNSLYMFEASARHLNFRLAAEELNLTQGAVAQRVRKLEQDLDCQLFTRKARGLELTDAGAGYAKNLRKAFVLIEDSTQALGQHPEHVRISVPPSFASKWLVPRLADFHRLHGQIDVEIEASEQLSDLQNGAVDLAVRLGDRPLDRTLEARFLASEDLAIVGHPSLIEGDRYQLDIASLDQITLIEDGHRHWQRLLGGHPAAHALSVLQVNQSALALDAARSGQGLALIPRLYLNDYIAQGELQIYELEGTRLEQQHPSGERGFYLLHKSRAEQSEAVQCFKSWIINQLPL